MPHRQPLLAQLRDYHARFPEESATVSRFRRFVQDHVACFERTLEAGHVTGSAWVLDPSGACVLLTHHRKLGRWLQLGGHADGDSDVLRVALREAEEESGLAVAAVASEGRAQILDLDIHRIPERRGRRGLEPAHEHYDVRFALRAASADFHVSEESLELAWVALDELGRYEVDSSVRRMAAKWLRLRAAAHPSATQMEDSPCPKPVQ